MKMLTLDARLTAIAEMIPLCRSVADIGTDHGLLGTYLLMQSRCMRVQFVDISAASLRKAVELVTGFGLRARSDFLVGDGASALTERPDCAVIAGMGGQTIAGIVEAGRATFEHSMLVMQPNVGIAELRSRLVRAGFRIIDEDIVRAGSRWYVILAARAGAAQYDARQLTVGPVLLQKRHEKLLDYGMFQLRVAEKALEGARRGGESGTIEALTAERAIWKEAIAWLQA